MNRRALGYAAAVLLAAAAFWYWPTDRRRIIAAGRELAEAASIPATEPDLARVTRAAVLSRLLAPGVRLVGPSGRVAIDGRRAALGLATRLRPPRGLTVSIADLDPSFGDDGRTATSRTTVTLREPGDRRRSRSDRRPGGGDDLDQGRRLATVAGDDSGR